MLVKYPEPDSGREQDSEFALRPKTWEEYIGQEKIKQGLSVIIEAAKKRSEPPEHLLFYGNSGLGKTSLAHVVANEVGSPIKTCFGPSLQMPGDVASILSNLQDGDVLFLDECHRVNKAVAETLYSAMEDFSLSLVVGKGPLARTMELTLPRFTLIGATTRIAPLAAPFRNRFGAIFQFDFYGAKDIERILERSASILNIRVEAAAVSALAERSRFTPRVANRLLRRVRDYATVEGTSRVTQDLVKKALGHMEVDEYGLEAADRRLLGTVIEKFRGGPVGLQSLAASVAEEQETILDIYEPYLLQVGFLERTPKGRVATRKAYEHLGFSPPGELL